MNKPVGTIAYESKFSQWLSKERFYRLHFKLTLLAVAQLERRDIAEDVASQCLIDTWMATSPEDRSLPVKSVLLKRLFQLIDCTKKNMKRQVATERTYIQFQNEHSPYEDPVPETTSAIFLLIPLLEPLEQQLFQLMIAENLDLEQIALRLQLPVSKVKRLYKNSIFRLRKKTGQWKIYE